jgi:hypothetical protein
MNLASSGFRHFGLTGHQFHNKSIRCLAAVCLVATALSCSGNQEQSEATKPERAIVNLADREQLGKFIVDHRTTVADVDTKLGQLREWANRRANDSNWLYPNAPEEARVINETTAQRDIAEGASQVLQMLSEDVSKIQLSDTLSRDVAAQLSRELSDRSRLAGDLRRTLQATSDEIIQHAGRIPGNLLTVARASGRYTPLNPELVRFLEKLRGS